jgi:hypothetical protein
MSKERRKFHRILFDAPVVIKQQTELNSTLIDISLNGALLHKPENWQAAMGEPVEMTVVLDHEASSTITMRAEVAHLDGDKIGLRCRDIDMESISHLRRLVELNLGDPELLERELESLG